MLGPREVLRFITTKSEQPPSNSCIDCCSEANHGIKKLLKTVDIQNFLRYNQFTFKNGDRQLIIKEEILHTLSGKLKELILCENNSYIDASFIFGVDPTTDDKVNDVIRDTEIRKLCDLNKVFFTLPVNIFCDTVSLIDRFISKVKVKPKYMSCLTAACFQLVTTFKGYKKVFLSLDNVSNIFRCGASGEDIKHMQQIVVKKLTDSFPLVTIYDFIEEIDPVAANDRLLGAILETVLTKFLICWHRPSRVAIAILVIYYQKNQQINFIERLYDMFKYDWDQIKFLSMSIAEQYSINSSETFIKNSREPLLWVISRKTFSNMYFANAPNLETIIEEEEFLSDV